MKIYFIGGQYESCYYVRCLIPLIANGWDGDKTSLRSPKLDGNQIFQGAMNADVIVFHRPTDQKKLEAAILLKKAGKIIVMDNDDTYREDSGVPLQMLATEKISMEKATKYLNSILVEFATIADLVTVSTEFLKKEYNQYNKNVVVIPNCIDEDDWDEPLKNETDKIRIGIVGSVASHKDYEPIIPLLNTLKDRNDIQLVLFALPPKKDGYNLINEIYKPEIDFWEQYKPEWQPFVPMADYMDTLNELKLDIMLIPRYDSYFNRCKSNLKYLEASMLEIPVIAQTFGDGQSPYDQDSEHIILANTPEEWTDKTLALIENKQRGIIGKQNKNYILEKYNIKNNFLKWKQEYQKCLEQ